MYIISRDSATKVGYIWVFYFVCLFILVHIVIVSASMMSLSIRVGATARNWQDFSLSSYNFSLCLTSSHNDGLQHKIFHIRADFQERGGRNCQSSSMPDVKLTVPFCWILLVKPSYKASPDSRRRVTNSTPWCEEQHGHAGTEGIHGKCLPGISTAVHWPHNSWSSTCIMHSLYVESTF